MTGPRRRSLLLLGILALGILLVVLAVVSRDESEMRPAAVERGDRPPVEDPSSDGNATGATLEIVFEPAGSDASWKLMVGRSAETAWTREGRGPASVVVPPEDASKAVALATSKGHVGTRVEVGASSTVLCLRRFGRIVGRVICDDEPCAQADVFIRRNRDPEAGGVSGDHLVHPEDLDRGLGLQKIRRTRTDNHGRFAFEGVIPGEGQFLRAMHVKTRLSEEISVRVEPGGEATVTLEVERGLVLRGTVLGQDGRPVPGIQVHVTTLRKDAPLTIWDQEASTTTDGEGRFLTPGLTPCGGKRIQLWWKDDGVHHVFSREWWSNTSEPAELDVGILRVRPTRIRFELSGTREPERHNLLVIADGDPDQGTFRVYMPSLVFDASGVIEVVGLPEGHTKHLVSYFEKSGRERALGRETMQIVPGPQVVRIHVDAPPPFVPTEDGFLRVEARAPIEAGEWIAIGHERAGLMHVFDAATLVERKRVVRVELPPGCYTGYRLSPEDGRVSSVTTEVSSGAEARLTLEAGGTGLVVPLTVLSEGRPVAGAVVVITGFHEGGSGMAIPVGRSDASGSLTVKCVPRDAKALVISAGLKDKGRDYSIPKSKFGGAEIDLEQPGVR